MYNVFQPIPAVIEDLYPYVVHIPDPEQWPEYLQTNPAKAHGLYGFYQGLRLGLQLAAAGLETI